MIALNNSADDSELGVSLAGSLFSGYDWALARDWSLGLQLTARGGTKPE